MEMAKNKVLQHFVWINRLLSCLCLFLSFLAKGLTFFAFFCVKTKKKSRATKAIFSKAMHPRKFGVIPKIKGILGCIYLLYCAYNSGIFSRIMPCKLALAFDRFDFELPTVMPSISAISLCPKPSNTYRLNTVR